jgi:diguanylate cyclase (GGDEF)-like protein
MLKIMSETLKKIIDLLTFKDLVIRKKFVLFSVGSLFWVVVIASIGLISLYEMNVKSKLMVDVIVPQEKTTNIILRKLRGTSISAHKIIIYKDTDIVNANYIRGKERLSDCRLYLDTLISGGIIKDYSRGTGQFYEEFSVPKISSEETKKFIAQLKGKIDSLDLILDDLLKQKLASSKKDGADFEGELSKFDAITRDTVIILNEYSISIGKEWKKFSSMIKTRTGISIMLMAAAFLAALFLSGVFGTLISMALSKPIKAIIEQIKSLSAGEVNLTKKLDVTSKDEIGSLSIAFNKLMDTIAHVTSFKKIIEEDESVEDIYLRLGRIFIDDLGFDNCVIYEISNSKNSMKIVYPPEAEGIELHCKRDINLNCDLCRAKRTGHIVTSADYQNICKYYLEETADIHYCVPIIVGGNVGGVVQFVCGKRGVCDIAGIEKKMSRAKQYITEAQPVLEAKRLMQTLKESAVKDSMTGLYNRRFIEETADSIMSGIQRRGTTLGFLMCDIDYFKQTNDQYGHDIGDVVLKEAANIISRSVRASDVVIRYGGEEFLILLLDSAPGNAMDIAEKIRGKMEEAKIRIPGGAIQKTISIGVSEMPADSQNFWESVKYADVALYKAKEGGRNRVVRFTADMWEEDTY